MADMLHISSLLRGLKLIIGKDKMKASPELFGEAADGEG